MTDNLEQQRKDFAIIASNYALVSKSSDDFLNRMNAAGFDLELIGKGATRRVYSAPHSLVVKVQREVFDLFTAQELIERGIDPTVELPSLASMYAFRRTANIGELMEAIRWPKLYPRLYSFVGSFGVIGSNPSVLVAESVQPLSLLFPGDKNRIMRKDIGVDSDGYMHIFDRRLTADKMPGHFQPLDDVSESYRLENLAITASGNHVFCDGGELSESVLYGLVMFPPEEITSRENVARLSWEAFDYYTNATCSTNYRKTSLSS